MLDFLRDRVGLVEGVVISGGEPTLHKDLPDFCGRVKAMGFHVKLDTNGTNPEMIAQLVGECYWLSGERRVASNETAVMTGEDRRL